MRPCWPYCTSHCTMVSGLRKGYDWDALGRLHDKGMICDPVGKAKSVVLTDEGLAESERLFRKLFVKSTPMGGAEARGP